MTRSWTKHQFIGILAIIFSCSSCGPLKEGTGAIPNDPLPAGAVVAQGPITGANGSTASGAALLYRLFSDGTIVIRLEGLSVPAGSNLKVVAKQAGAEVYQTSLRNVQGTQNYNTSSSIAVGWNSVSIRSGATERDVAIAVLTQSP